MKFNGNLLNRNAILFLFIIALAACQKDRTAPGDITDLVAIGGVEEVTLTWTEPPDEDLFSIQITEVGANKIYVQPSGYNGITIQELTNGLSYEFAVTAVDENGNKSNPVHASATPAPPFVVVDPDQNNYESSVYVSHPDGYETITPSASFEIDPAGQVHISITFNRPLDITSVLSGQTVYFEGSSVSSGDLSFSEENKTLTFSSTESFSSFGTSEQAASYTAYIFEFVLLGDDIGNGAILDSNGMPLDGDGDEVAGGDFRLELTVNEENN